MSESKQAVRIGNLLGSLSMKKNWVERLGLHAVFLFWNEALGQDICRKAQPHVIHGTVLWVHVADSIWMQQLQLEKLTLLDQINQRLPGEKKLTDIRFQLESGLERRTGPAAPLSPRKKRLPAAEEVQRFEKILATLNDEEARQALRRLWRKSHER